jgi:3-methylfumaryl-CoA hydratase
MNYNSAKIDNSLNALGDTAETAIRREEVCAQANVRRIAAMLDLAKDGIEQGRALPRGWHFFLLAADTHRSNLRSDGFPGLGVRIPDLGLPRLVLGGRNVHFLEDIPIGATVHRQSSIKSIVQKPTATAAIAVVTVNHSLLLAEAQQPALIEEQTYLLLPARTTGETASALLTKPPITSLHQKMVTIDEILLFQYSALCFNSHRIHTDRDYARNVEGFPDLVVNGGLATLLLTEFMRQDLRVTPTAIFVRHVAPLFCNRTLTLTADRHEAGWSFKALDEQNNLAVDMRVEV